MRAAGGDWTFSTCGAAVDTVLFVETASGTCCGAEFVNDDFCDRASEITIAGLRAGQTVYVTLETASFIGCGPFTLEVRD